MQQSSETEVSSKWIPQVKLVITLHGHKTITDRYHFWFTLRTPLTVKNCRVWEQIFPLRVAPAESKQITAISESSPLFEYPYTISCIKYSRERQTISRLDLSYLAQRLMGIIQILIKMSERCPNENFQHSTNQWGLFATMLHYKKQRTVELQWLKHRWLVYHGYFELVLVSLETFPITGDIIVQLG